MNTKLLTPLAIAAMTLTSLVPDAQAAVPGMKVTKLYSPRPATQNWFGDASVLTDRYALVGEPGKNNGIPGMVHVFDAGTGALVRSLKPTVSTADDKFGSGIVVQGNLALVWAHPGSTGNSVYLMDITTGKQLRRFTPGAGADDSQFGRSLILTSTHAIISNPGDASLTGAVYVFSLASNDPPQKVTDTNGAAGDQLGSRLYQHGSLLLISAPLCDGGKGAVYRYDLASNVMLNKIQPAGVSANDWFGGKLTGWGSTVFVSAQFDDTTAGNDAGSVYTVRLDGTFDATPFNLDPNPGADRLFGWMACQSGNLVVWGAGEGFLIADAARRQALQYIPFDQLGLNEFADDWSLANNRLLIGNTSDSTFAAESGTAVLVQLIAEPLAGYPIATKGDSAPGAVGIAFNDLNSATINPNGRVFIASSLSGTGSNAGKDKGVFDDLANADLLDLAGKTRDDLGAGVKIATLTAPLMNDSNALFQATLSGTGISALNNKALLRDNGATTTPLLRTGAAQSAFSGAVVSNFSQPVQSSSMTEFASVLSFRPGVAGTDATKDSGLATFDSGSGSLLASEREGEPTKTAGVNFGQFIRTSYQYGDVACTAMVSGAAAQNQAVFSKTLTDPAMMVARKGEPAPGVSGGVFSSFLGEAMNSMSHPVIRATLSGAGINATNNEGVWQTSSAALALIARTGSPAPGMKAGSGIVWHRFTQVCAQADRTVIRGLLRGPGITSANDEIVVLFQEDDTFLTLWREGEAVHGCNGAKGGAITRMEVAPDGQYRALVTIAGASSATNLALIGGSTQIGDPGTGSSLRRPKLMLRKGSLVSLSPVSAPARVSSLAFTHAGSQDTTGMGCKGLPGITSSSGTLIKATLSNGSTHLLKLE